MPTSHTHSGGFVGTLGDESFLFMCPRNDFQRMCVCVEDEDYVVMHVGGLSQSIWKPLGHMTFILLTNPGNT